MNHELDYYNDMDELYKSINQCIDILEESVGTCNEKSLLPLLEDAHSALEQLSKAIRKYEKE